MRNFLFILYLIPSFLTAAPFTDHGDGTVTDQKTGLMWQQQDDLAIYTWSNALSQCEGLSFSGHTDWRVPNIKELSTIVDDTRISSPAIDPTAFLRTQSNYWTSTVYAPNTTNAWFVSFLFGDVGSSNQTGTFYVRCVR